MSGRYGRNQKRRHRAEMERLRADLRATGVSCHRAQQEAALLKDRLRRSVEIAVVDEPLARSSQIQAHWENGGRAVAVAERVEQRQLAVLSKDGRDALVKRIAAIIAAQLPGLDGGYR